MNHAKINRALDDLQAEGMQLFDEAGDVNKYAAIGAALAQVEDSVFAIGKLAHEYWEEHNAHDLAALLRWVFHHYLTQGGPVYVQEAEWIKHLVDTDGITLYERDGTSKRYTVTVVIQEI